MAKNSPGPATEKIIKLVKKRLHELGLSPYQAARKAGLPDDAIRTVINGCSPSVDRLNEISKALNIDLLGELNKNYIKDKNSNNAEVYVELRKHRYILKEILSRLPEKKKNEVSEVSAIYSLEQIKEAHHIPVFEADVAAGAGALNESEQVISYVAFRPDWLSKHRLNPQQCAIIRVIGESMEPTLLDKSAVLVDRNRQRRHAGHIYVIRTEDGLIVKRLGKDKRGNWLLISDNPTWDNAPLPSNAEIIGEARWTAKTLV